MKTKPDGLVARLREIWRLAGRVNLRQRTVLMVAFGYPILGTVLYEGTAYGYGNPYFWLSVPASYAVFGIAYFLFSIPFKHVPRLATSTIGKTAAVYFSYLLKSAATVGIVGGNFEVALELWLVRAPGDATLTIAGWLALATAVTANLDYRTSLSKLNSVSAELETQRDARASAALVADQTLRKLALENLNPELEKIRKGLRSAQDNKDAWRLGAEIRNLVTERVRPLSQDLVRRIDLVTELKIDQPKPISTSRVPHLAAKPRLDSRMAFAYFVGIPNIFVTVMQLSSLQAALWVLLVSISFPVIAQLGVLLWPRAKSIKIETALVFGAFTMVIAYVPTLVALHFFSRQFQTLEVIRITAFVVLMFLATAFSLWATFQRSRDEQLADILEQQAKIKRELTLIDQELWLARRRWAYLIHGTVQGALTVASSRLVLDPTPSAQTMRKVLADVEVAKKALQGRIQRRQNARELIMEIRASWKDVCDFHPEIAEDVYQILNGSLAAKDSFVEVCKELVSNAYRHGKARNIWISAFSTGEGDLRIISTNDGSAIGSNPKPGVGAEIFDHLTSSWGFEVENEARFVATIPLAKA